MGILLFVKNFTLIIEYIQFIEIMNRYTIHCTPEQTKKAIELGAQIVILPNYTEYRVFPLVKCKDGNERPCVIPTAEQMRGWIMYNGAIDFYVDRDLDEELNYCDTYGYVVAFDDENRFVGTGFNSYIEATLAAIDAAFEYLEEQKK